MNIIWYAAIAAGVVILVVAYVLLQKKKESNKQKEIEQAEQQRRLQIEKEKREKLEKKRSEWLDKSEPLRNKLATIIAGDSFPILENDEYLVLSNLFDHAGEGVEFIMHCDSYNGLLEDDGFDEMTVSKRSMGSKQETTQPELIAIARQIEDLVNGRINSL